MSFEYVIHTTNMCMMFQVCVVCTPRIYVPVQTLAAWKRTSKELKIIDTRGQALGGEESWVLRNMQLAGLTSKLKAVDFVRLSRDRGVTSYLFKGVFKPGEEALEGALNALLDALVLSMEMVCDLNGQPPTAAMKAKFSKHVVDMASKLARFEKDAPGTFPDVLLHELLHVPHAVMRWGSVRNFWCFFGERYVGWITNFICQRNHPSKSMVNGYSRHTFMRRIHPETRDRLHRRLLATKANVTMRGFLVPTQELLAKRGPGRGAGKLKLTSNWRNSRVLKKDNPLSAELTKFLTKRYAQGEVPKLTLVPQKMCIMQAGVEVDGVPWKVGYCGLFTDHDSGAEVYGEVTELLLWKENVEETAVLRVKTHTIVSEERGMITVRAKCNRRGVLLLWHCITHKCKKLTHIGNNAKLRTVLRVVETNAEVEIV